MDMRLISVKDGGIFALSWIAGTNAKALRTNSQRYRIHTVDIPDVCEQMMETIKSSENKLSFRILFRLCLGTIHIYAEQVENLYNVTLNFVCFNTFVLKQLSRKRGRSSVNANSDKRRRLTSSEGIDFTNLLLESEIFNNYSEEKFEFPQENSCGAKKTNTSTCIQIKQITIRQISWDNPQIEDDDGDEAFGEATQDDQMMLLSQLTDTVNVTKEHESNKNGRKRKFSNPSFDCPPAKRSTDFFNKSTDDVRCAPSTCNETVSEFCVDIKNRVSTDGSRNIPSPIESRFTQDDILSTQGNLLSQNQPLEDQFLNETTNCIPVDLSFHIQRGGQNGSVASLIPPQTSTRKRRSQQFIDRVTKIQKNQTENIWQNCFNMAKRDHIAKIEKYVRREVSFSKTPSRSLPLLVPFKSNLKSRWKQLDIENRRILLEEILGEKFEFFKDEFKLKSRESSRAYNQVHHENKQKSVTSQTFQFDENNNYSTTPDMNNSWIQDKENAEYEPLKKEVLSLKCSLDQIDLRKMSFYFPNEAGKQRSEWGKEGILMKLVFAWRNRGPVINMNTIIVGANRINAALSFHTLLDLAGQQYIEIVKTETNFIESIKMGPEMIRKINETYLAQFALPYLTFFLICSLN